jgi:ATP-binding protein involved in chromosome partitioning
LFRRELWSKNALIGFFVKKEDAVVWRGAMASNALKQLIGDADWGELDYFLIDFLRHQRHSSHACANVAHHRRDYRKHAAGSGIGDARKGISMFTGDKVNVPILGLVENMSWFTPAELPENKYYIFGKEGCKRLAEELGYDLLGQIPIVQSIRESGDEGRPVALNADSITGMAFAELADHLVAAVDKRNRELPPTQIVGVAKR